MLFETPYNATGSSLRSRRLSNLKIKAIWNTPPCSLVEVDHRFRQAYCLHHQGGDRDSKRLWNAGQFYETARHNIPDSCHLHNCRCVNLKSVIKFVLLLKPNLGQLNFVHRVLIKLFLWSEQIRLYTCTWWRNQSQLTKGCGFSNLMMNENVHQYASFWHLST